jgi:hypothetical protein
MRSTEPTPATIEAPGADLLRGAMDNHVHVCPHLNGRSMDVFQAVEAAATAGMSAIGLMDNFANSSGYAALASRHLGHLGVEVFGGIILEPPAGGVSAETVRIALGYGYGAGDGARFISLPTHHTRNIAIQERRPASYVEDCFHVPESGPLPDPLPEIIDLIVAADAVLNTGHVSGPEAVRLVEAAVARGCRRILVPSSYYEEDEIREITGQGAYAEFSFFFVSHATQVGLTHVDEEAHTVQGVTVPQMARRIRAAGTARSVLSGDCGVFVLPPPVEGLREFLLLMESAGFDRDALRQMTGINPKQLFHVGESA